MTGGRRATRRLRTRQGVRARGRVRARHRFSEGHRIRVGGDSTDPGRKTPVMRGLLNPAPAPASGETPRPRALRQRTKAIANDEFRNNVAAVAAAELSLRADRAEPTPPSIGAALRSLAHEPLRAGRAQRKRGACEIAQSPGANQRGYRASSAGLSSGYLN